MRILISGIKGQIASYLAELYLEAGYEVYGLYRRNGIDNFDNIEHIKSRIKLYVGDITDTFSLLDIFNEVKPDYFINTAAQSEVGTSFTNPYTTFDITGKGVLNILEIIRRYYPECKFLQFSSSEMFGSAYIEKDGVKYQNEDTELAPMSPYAVAKLAGYHLTKVYRESYNLFASNIIAFNSESPRRKDYFVTRKITKWLGEYIVNKNIYNGLGIELKLALGNIDSMRSWTHAKDTARAAKLILDHHNPDDFCIGKQECKSVKDFLVESFSYKGLDWQDYVYQDPQFMRPNDLTYLRPKTTKAQEILGWWPEISFKELVREMVDADETKAKQKP